MAGTAPRRWTTPAAEVSPSGSRRWRSSRQASAWCHVTGGAVLVMTTACPGIRTMSRRNAGTPGAPYDA